MKNDPSASNTLREWRILVALEDTAVPHPKPLLLCEDTDVIGAPFLIMELVDGFTPASSCLSRSPRSRRCATTLGWPTSTAARISRWSTGAAVGSTGLGKPEGFLERQVPRWLAQFDRYRTRELPELDFLCQWLTDNTPPMSPAAIIHGDYSPFNVMVAPDPPARLAAILDWDTGTIGDPLLDLGHLLARWTEPGERPVLTLQAGDNEGYPTRAEMAHRYAERTGRDLSALPYYEALALFKLAVILEGRHAQECASGVPAGETSMATIVPDLLRGAAEFARGERV